MVITVRPPISRLRSRCSPLRRAVAKALLLRATAQVTTSAWAAPLTTRRTSTLGASGWPQAKLR